MKNIGKKILIDLLIGSIVFISSIFILWIWNGLHKNSELLIENCYANILCTMENYSFYAIFISWFLLLIFLTVSCYALIEHKQKISKSDNQKKLNSTDKISTWNLFILSLIPIIITLIIFGLLIIDLTVIFLTFDLEKIYQNIQTKEFLIKLYTVGLGVIVFGVQLYVAYVRRMALKQANETFEFSQKQFDYTQIQKINEEIEKRFQEGIKLLGNENESVRLGGIYILWNIVQEAVKSLEKKYNEHVKLYCHSKGKVFKDGMAMNNNIPEIISYAKSYSLHKQILNILCSHIRTQTNSEKYLKQYYPSIYQGRYPKQFKEAFGEKGENNYLLFEDEKPSNEIQTLLDLLTQSNDNNKNNIPNYILRFRLDFENAILGGAFCYNAYFEGANCWGAHFEWAQLLEANFEGAYCVGAHFEESDCMGAHFDGADCQLAHFDGADCTGAHFVRANCTHAHFEDAKCQHAHFERANYEEASFEGADCEEANFNGAWIKETTFSADKIINCNFNGINCDLGECGVLDDNGASIILIDKGQNNTKNKEIVSIKNKDCLAELYTCPSLKMDTPWRIPITEVKQYIDVDFFHDNEKISNCLIAFQAAYEAHNNDKDLFFASLSPEDQKLARYYLNDFGDQDPEDANDQPPLAMEESQKTP